MTGVRRVLDNAAHRALAAPPTRAQEARWVRIGVGAVVLAVVGFVGGNRLSRP